MRCEWHGPCFFSHGSNHVGGVAILFDFKLPLEQARVIKEKDGRVLIMTIKINDVIMVLVNVYAPTKLK